MLRFYRNATLALLGLVLLTIAIVYAGVIRSRLNASLFPADDAFLWASAIEPKTPQGKTQLTLTNEVGTVEYDFFLDPEKPFPYSHYSIYFIDQIQSFMQVDLSRYSGISFKIQCDPKNVLLLVLFSFDDKVTNLNNMASRRVSSTAFSCDKHWTTVDISFDDLDTPHWWLGRYGYDFSETGYQLDKTMGFAWVNSLQSPLNTPSHVKLTDVKLVGTDSRFIYVATGLSFCLWILFFIWLVRRYVRILTFEIKERVKQDQPFIAYKKLSIEPQKDKEKSSVLRFVATEYANPDLSLEGAAAALGTNRTKINDILKEELGLTFTAYLNKLRLTEAARLLSENPDTNVSEIAYSVGYNNVSYFNKLFKHEYGCAPKTFKDLYISKDTDEIKS
jgi:AraC-like DNA-binding protein